MSSLKKCFRKKRRVGNTSSSFDAGGRIPPSGLPPVRRPLCHAGLRGHAGRKRLPPARADKSIISDSGGIARDYFLPGPAGARPVSAGGGKIDFFSMAGYTILLLMQLLSREVMLIFHGSRTGKRGNASCRTGMPRRTAKVGPQGLPDPHGRLV